VELKFEQSTKIKKKFNVKIEISKKDEEKAKEFTQ